MESYELTRLLFLRALAVVYAVAFAVAINQFRVLCGKRGILPVRRFLERSPSFWSTPSVFRFWSTDCAFAVVAWAGLFLSLLAIFGLSEQWGFTGHIIVWLLLWVFYQSFVNVGQVFYGFGWESLLLETGFLAIFAGPANVQMPVVIIWMLKWVLFRVMFGAGLIKLRGSECWRSLTCMDYHYETQPMPNPFSWYLHHLPKVVHKTEVLLTHIVELAVPWMYFMAGLGSYIGGGLTALFMLGLILSGNLSWLNYLTLVLCISCFDDAFFSYFLPLSWAGQVAAVPSWYMVVLVLLTFIIVVLSVQPAVNLFSRRQLMNASFDRLHLVNTYGAFGHVTQTRYEVVILGTSAEEPHDSAEWLEYQFRGKPGDPSYHPPVVAPYHLRLDWQLWFAAMSTWQHHSWFMPFLAKLLRGDQDLTGLLRVNPFSNAPPRWIRADWYEYHFTDTSDCSGNWWTRRRVGEYMRPISLDLQQVQLCLELRE